MAQCFELTDQFHNYLRDESRSSGYADHICFPKTESEILKVVAHAVARNVPITIQGALTGLAAAAVPQGGLIINTSRMDKIISLRYDQTLQTYLIQVQPGLALSSLNQAVDQKNFPYSDWDALSSEVSSSLKMGEWFFAPDPTEISASVGGMAACNASGAKTYFYGPMRDYVYGLRMVLTNGEILDTTRGQYRASGNIISFKVESGKEYHLSVPDYSVNPDVKSAAGYYVREDMDLLDIIVGSEGTLGVITELTLKLSKRPRHTLAVVAFTQNQKIAIDLVHAIRGDFQDKRFDRLHSHKALAIEYFDSNSIDLLRTQQMTTGVFSQIPELKPEYEDAIYVEYGFETAEELDQTVTDLGSLLDSLGCNLDNSWVGVNKQQRERLRHFRHACPECVNLKVDENRRKCSEITKLGTDMSVPDDFLDQSIKMYQDDLERLGIKYAMFGHIGQNHLHVNVLPKTKDEYDKARQQYIEWSKQIVNMGGSVAAEHGIGKLKTSFLEIMYPPEAIDQMRKVKQQFDPSGILNIGNIFTKGS